MTDPDPLLALDLRLRFLETVLAGSPEAVPRAAAASRAAASGSASVASRGEEVVRKLEEVLQAPGGNEPLRRFVDQYDVNAPLLSLPLPTSASASSSLSAAEQASLVLESEPDIRQLDSDLRALETLDRRGAAGAGQLAICEKLAPELEATAKELPAREKALESLEAKTSTLLARYDAYVDTLSELFISWDGILSYAEAQVTRLEKERADEL